MNTFKLTRALAAALIGLAMSGTINLAQAHVADGRQGVTHLSGPTRPRPHQGLMRSPATVVPPRVAAPEAPTSPLWSQRGHQRSRPQLWR